MKKFMIVAALMFVAGGASAQVSIPAEGAEPAPGPAVIATDTAVRERVWPDFHAVEIQGVMSVRLKVADAEHPVGVNFYTSDPSTGKYTREVENGVLKLKVQKAQSADSVRVTVYYTKLDRINADRDRHSLSCIIFTGIHLASRFHTCHCNCEIRMECNSKYLPCRRADAGWDINRDLAAVLLIHPCNNICIPAADLTA